jgi:hypothetical protein
MIHIDFQQIAVAVEGDGNVDHLITVRTLQTDGAASRVVRFPDANPSAFERTDASVLSLLGREVAIEETIRSRQGANVSREYDLDLPGIYCMMSGRRGSTQHRTFFLMVEFLNNEEMQITVLPASSPSQWIINDDLHTIGHGETYSFAVRVTQHGMATGEGEVTRIASGQAGVKFARTTAWERLMDDDDADSV